MQCRLLWFVLATTAVGSSVSAEVSRIYLSPGNILLVPGCQQQFQIFAVDGEANHVPAPAGISWSADPLAGTVTPEGMFAAVGVPGFYPRGVRASAPGGLSTNAPVEITLGHAQGGYAFQKAWGEFTAGQFANPRSAAVDDDGNIYLNAGGVVQRFDSEFNFLDLWGPDGGASATWEPASALEVDNAGYIYGLGSVLVQKRDASGTLIDEWGGYGFEPGHLIRAIDVAVDNLGRSYVLESYGTQTPNYVPRVSVFDPAGNFITRWGLDGTAPDELRLPKSLATDSAASVYIADTDNKLVKKFTFDGSLLTSWGSYGTAVPLAPCGVDTDDLDNVYVTYNRERLVQKFTAAGGFLTEWQVPLTPNATLRSDNYVSVDTTGNVYFIDTANDAITKLDAGGSPVATLLSLDANGQFSAPQDVAVDSEGFLYVADSNNDRIQKFDSSGNFERAWGKRGGGNSQLIYPVSLAVESGFVYVADYGNDRVQKFDSLGNYISQFGPTGPGADDLESPCAIAVDGSGNIYVAESTRYRIVKYDAQGDYLGQFGDLASSPTYVHGAGCLAVDSAGNVFVSEINTQLIKRYDSSGALTAQWGGYGGNNENLYGPTGLEMDQYDRLYVVDQSSNRLVTFTTSGEYLFHWRAWENTPPFLATPAGVCVSKDSTVYVVDLGRSRLQVLSPIPPGPTVKPFIDDGVYTANLSSLSASWIYEPLAFLKEYEYAVGTTPSVPDSGLVVPWTSAGRSSQASVTNLSLQNCQTYYWYVRARHRDGSFSPTGISDGITVALTPPAPMVTDDGLFTLNGSSLHATWSLSAGWDCAQEYEYAIGTLSSDIGSGYVVPWTSAGQATEVTKQGLTLERGKRYYFYVRAKSKAGNTGPTGASNGIAFPHQPTSLGAVKALPQSEALLTGNLVVTTTTGDFPGYVFVQDESRAAGMRLNAGLALQRGQRIEVLGRVRRANGEWQLDLTEAVNSASGQPAMPLGATQRSIAAADLDEDLALEGVDPAALLMKVSGRVTGLDTAARAFYIDDGSGLKDGMMLGGQPSRGLRVSYRTLAPPQVSERVRIVGIVRVEKKTLAQAAMVNGTLRLAGETVYIPSIHARDQQDIYSE